MACWWICDPEPGWRDFVGDLWFFGSGVVRVGPLDVWVGGARIGIEKGKFRSS